MAMTKQGAHAAAVTRMLRATGLLRIPEEAPLVELVKSLAREMDAGGGSRTYSAYLSALKDVRRVLSSAPGDVAPKDDAVEEEAPTVEAEKAAKEVADFASFKRAKGSAA
jgi:hypothetical protein